MKRNQEYLQEEIFDRARGDAGGLADLIAPAVESVAADLDNNGIGEGVADAVRVAAGLLVDQLESAEAAFADALDGAERWSRPKAEPTTAEATTTEADPERRNDMSESREQQMRRDDERANAAAREALFRRTAAREALFSRRNGTPESPEVTTD